MGRTTHNREVAGSSPAPATRGNLFLIKEIPKYLPGFPLSVYDEPHG